MIGKTSLKRQSIQKKHQIYEDDNYIVPGTNDPISTENAPMDLSKSEDGSDEDPFAELESILLGSPQFLPKVTCSTRNVALSAAFHNLECLLEKSLESIL
ncbi:disease resistance protein DSC1 [Trifolium repens]|nr:disease resistance protein DSC1 [Trifolium repens]